MQINRAKWPLALAAIAINLLQLSAAAQLGCGRAPITNPPPNGPVGTGGGAVTRPRSLATTHTTTSGPSGSVLVSDQSITFIIDGNGNGPDPSDCRFMATLSAIGVLTITTVQDGTTPLSACAAIFGGNIYEGSDTSSDYVGAAITSMGPLSAMFESMRVELVDEEDSPDGRPVRIDDPRDAFEVASLATGELWAIAKPCANSSRMLVVETGNGVSEYPLDFATDTGGQLYAKITIPIFLWELLPPPPGLTTSLNVYVPVTNDHKLTLAFASDPTDLYVDVDLDALPPCAGRRAAPAIAPLSLATLSVLLLLSGAWLVMRRRGRR